MSRGVGVERSFGPPDESVPYILLASVGGIYHTVTRTSNRVQPRQPDAGVVDGQHRSMSPVHGGRPDRIGPLFDDACPTAGTPDTGLAERLPEWVRIVRIAGSPGRRGPAAGFPGASP